MAQCGFLFFLGVLCLGWVLTGCSETPPECERANDGEFVYSTVPQLGASDSTSNVQVTVVDAVLDTIVDFSNNVSPKIEYRFRATAYPRLDVSVDYIGSTIPVEQDSTYTIFFEKTQGSPPKSMAISISDEQGLRYLAVNDWYPSGDERARVFENGYPALGNDGEPRVFLVEAGCEPRLEDDCFRSITNYRLDFVLGSEPPLELWNGEEGQVGSWIFHVHKAEEVIPNQGCFAGILAANSISFSVERSGLR